MLGRFCDISRRTRHERADSEVQHRTPANKVCPICGGGEYQLIFQVEALTDRATLLLECKLCLLRKELVAGD